MNVKRGIRLVLLLIIVATVMTLLYRTRGILYPFLVGLLIAYLLNRPVQALERRGLKRIYAIAVLYLLILGSFTLITMAAFPLIVGELEEFSAQLPQISDRIEDMGGSLQHYYHNADLPVSLRTALDDSVINLQNSAQRTVTGLVQAILAAVGLTLGIAISPILAFYILLDWKLIGQSLLRLVPSGYQHDMHKLVVDLDEVLNGVIRAQIIVALFVGVMITLGLYFLQIQFALIIGIFAGALDIIPYFGPAIGCIPALAMALLDSPWAALKVVALFTIVNQIEGSVIGPKIMGDSVGLHPLSVIFLILVGGELAGLLGMLVAVPIAALTKVIARHILKRLV